MSSPCDIALAGFSLLPAARWTTAIVLACSLLVGCRQIVGIEPRQVFDVDASGAVPLSCGLPNRQAECASCMAENCCTEARGCVADEMACLPAEQCLQTCAAGDAPCLLGCGNKWNLGETARLEICRYQACANACRPWECLGRAQWPLPDPFPDRITIRATASCMGCGAIGGVGVNEGVRVRVCSLADPHCDAELQRAVSGQDGRVSMVINTQKRPLSVYLEFHKEGFLDDLVLLNTPPLSSDFDVGAVIMDTRESVDQIADQIGTRYDPALALVKLTVFDCNLRPSVDIDLDWSNRGMAVDGQSESNLYTVNLPVVDSRATGDAAAAAAGLTRLVARLKAPAGAANDAAVSPPIVAVVNAVVRSGAITLAPFVTPSP